MAFEWLRFFEQHGIEFQEGGANTSRNNVTVHCPFCGGADPSKHMSVNLLNKGWRCWRDPAHRGINPARLVHALLGCSWQRALQIVGRSVYVPTDFIDRVRGAVSPRAQRDERKGLTIPKEFRVLDTGMRAGRLYENYLVHERGFDWDDLQRLSNRYDVRYCARGPYAGRVIFLVYHMGDLVAWTGRAVSSSQELRYKALSDDEERAHREGYEPALGPISHYLLWFDDLLRVSKPSTLVLCEGPFDALKVDVLGRSYGVRATCFFTAAPTDAQISLLHELCPQFKRTVLLLDRGTLALGMRIAQRLSGLGVITRQLPKGLKDPGEFDIHSFRKFALAHLTP